MIHDLKPYPAYKDSGVPWLGKVPEHWKFNRAKWLFQKMNRPVRPDDDVVTCFRDGTVTLRKNRRVSGFTESLKEIGYQGVRRGDLVIHAMDAFAGAIGVSDSDGKCTPVYSVCQPFGNVNSNYYAYIVREMSQSQWIAALAKGIRERSTDFRYDGFASQNVPIPPRQEQDQIVAFIDRIDRRIRHYIRAKKKLIKLLEEQKQAIIHQAVTRGLDPNVKLKPSGVEWLGDVPEDWHLLRLKDAVFQIVDTEHKTAPFYENGNYLVVRTSNVKNGQLLFSDAKYTDEDGFKEWTRRGIPEPGDILFTREAPAGEACLVPEGLPLCLGQRMVLFRVNPEVLDSQFGLHSIYGGAAAEFIRQLLLGSTVPHFNMFDIACIPMLLPPIDEQKKIASFLNHESKKISEAIDHAYQKISLLREFRTRLIADVVTGKLDVREAASNLSEKSDEMEVEDDFEEETIEESLEEVVTEEIVEGEA